MNPRPPEIGLYAESIHHFLETVALALAERERSVVHLVTAIRPLDPASEDPHARLRLAARPEIRLHDVRGTPVPLDYLFVRVTGHASVPRAVFRWARHARKWGLLTENHYEGARGSGLREWIRGFPYTALADRAVFQAGAETRDPFRLRHRLHYAPTAHPQFLSDPALRQRMFAEVEAETPRRWRLIFTGNLDPAPRTAILRRVQSLLAARGNRPATDPSEAPAGTPVLWMEYGEGATGRGLDPEGYVAAMTQSDFSLSPPGYAVWTHRTAEAVLRGAIPIVEHPEHDNVGLVDGETCITVREGRWEEAVTRALDLPPDRVTAMRRALLAKCRKHLLFDAYAQRVFDGMTA